MLLRIIARACMPTCDLVSKLMNADVAGRVYRQMWGCIGIDVSVRVLKAEHTMVHWGRNKFRCSLFLEAAVLGCDVVDSRGTGAT